MAVLVSGGLSNPYMFASTFSDNSWEDIVNACRMNRVPDTWVVGDNKPMVINGVEYQIDIIGKNHDVYSDGTGIAPLTFQMHHSYATEYAMNATDTNKGGWTDSVMRSTHIPAILSLMPTEIQSALHEVNKLTSAGSTSSTIVTTADKLFLLSEIEVLGLTAQSKEGEGTRYEYYAKGNSVIKKVGNIDSAYWVRSPKNTNSGQFCVINGAGEARILEAADTAGVSLAFCF